MFRKSVKKIYFSSINCIIFLPQNVDKYDGYKFMDVLMSQLLIFFIHIIIILYRTY